MAGTKKSASDDKKKKLRVEKRRSWKLPSKKVIRPLLLLPGVRKAWSLLPRLKPLILAAISAAIHSVPYDVQQLEEVSASYMGGTNAYISRWMNPKDARSARHWVRGSAPPPAGR